jgi:hypothetical protein
MLFHSPLGRWMDGVDVEDVLGEDGAPEQAEALEVGSD